MAAVARWVALPGVRWRAGLAAGQQSARVRGLWSADVGDGRDDLRSRAHPADGVVRGWVADDQPEARRLGARPATRAGAGLLSDGMGDAAPLPQGDGAPGRERVRGLVEVDEAYLGGTEEGVDGRETETKAIVAIAVEIKQPKGFGRIRMQRVPDVAQESLIPFVTGAVEPGATVHTDGWQAYWTVPDHGYEHKRTVMRKQTDPAHVVMPGVHRVSSLLKRWLLGTHQGSVSPEHLDAYLNEFTFRFNRRGSRRRGMLFYRLLEQAVLTGPVTYRSLIVNPSRTGRRPARPLRSRAIPAVERPWRQDFSGNATNPRSRVRPRTIVPRRALKLYAPVGAQWQWTPGNRAHTKPSREALPSTARTELRSGPWRTCWPSRKKTSSTGSSLPNITAQAGTASPTPTTSNGSTTAQSC